MVKKTNGTNSPMNTGALKRVFGVLVVLLVASVLMVGAGSANTELETEVSSDTTVVTETPAETGATKTVTTNDELEEAINAASGPTTIEITADGTYTLPLKSMKNTDLTFIGGKGVIFDLTEVSVSVTQSATGATITFDGVTVKFKEGANANYNGFGHVAKVVYKNCTLTGSQTMYANDVEFTNCTFTNQEYWSVQTYGAKNVDLTNCTFNTGGHAVLIYNEKTNENFVANVNFTNCVFNNSGVVNEQYGPEQLVETGTNEYASSDNIYHLKFTNCKIEGNGKQLLWGNKKAMDDDHLTVTIDGAKQALIYKITWKIEGATDTYSFVAKGTTPEYTGNTPTKEANATYTFQFAGWEPQLEPVTTAAEYTATFTEIKKEVTPTAPAQGVTTDDGTKVTVGTDESIVLPEGTSTTDNEVDVTEATIKTDSGVNITLVYSENDKATVNKSEGTITGNTTGVVAAYPAASVQSNNAEVPVTYELELSLNPETVKTGIPLPTINTTINTDVANAIGVMKDGNGDAFEPLAMIQATYADGIDQVNNNLTGDKIKLTFVVPASAGTDFVAFHIKNGVPNLLDENSVEIKKDTPAGYTTIILTVEHFSGYAIATGTYPAEQKQTQSSSSSSSGSSVWLTETQTQQPTATPTPTETAQPTDAVPTDIPVTQPTSEPASPGFGILAALAGLGAVAALRRQ